MSFYGEATGAAATPLGLGKLSSLDLGREFRKYFGVVRATTEALRQEAYAIRHRVYCEELGHEAPRPDGREVDAHDAHAEHLLLGSVEHSRYVACARMIPAGMPGAPLPIEEACAATLGARWTNLKRSRRIAELSRLAVTAEFRRRKGEQDRGLSIGDADFGTATRPRFPYVPVGLALAAIALARRQQIDVLVVLTEPQIATHFARLGMALQQIGGPVQQRGTRVPYAMSVGDIVGGMRSFMRPLYRVIDQDLDGA